VGTIEDEAEKLMAEFVQSTDLKLALHLNQEIIPNLERKWQLVISIKNKGKQVVIQSEQAGTSMIPKEVNLGFNGINKQCLEYSKLAMYTTKGWTKITHMAYYLQIWEFERMTTISQPTTRRIVSHKSELCHQDNSHF
jgi:hypothetical protein